MTFQYMLLASLPDSEGLWVERTFGPFSESEAMEKRAALWDKCGAGQVQMFRHVGVRLPYVELGDFLEQASQIIQDMPSHRSRIDGDGDEVLDMIRPILSTVFHEVFGESLAGRPTLDLIQKWSDWTMQREGKQCTNGVPSLFPPLERCAYPVGHRGDCEP